MWAWASAVAAQRSGVVGRGSPFEDRPDFGNRREMFAAMRATSQTWRRSLADKSPDFNADGIFGNHNHAIGEEGVSLREIAEVIGRGLDVPVVAMSPQEASNHFGFLSMFAGLDLTASSAQTQKRLGWKPTGPGLIADLEQMRYVAA